MLKLYIMYHWGQIKEKAKVIFISTCISSPEKCCVSLKECIPWSLTVRLLWDIHNGWMSPSLTHNPSYADSSSGKRFETRWKYHVLGANNLVSPAGNTLVPALHSTQRDFCIQIYLSYYLANQWLTEYLSAEYQRCSLLMWEHLEKTDGYKGPWALFRHAHQKFAICIRKQHRTDSGDCIQYFPGVIIYNYSYSLGIFLNKEEYSGRKLVQNWIKPNDSNQ